MKKTIMITLLISQVMMSFGQDLKTVKKKENEREGKATFYVLASNDTIKHGDYKVKSYMGSRIVLKGQYNNNSKVGLWVEQYYGGFYKGPKATGYYENNKKVGEWIYFTYDGDTAQIYNWSLNKLISLNLCGVDTFKHTVIENGIESKHKLDCPPTCASGIHYFFHELDKVIINRDDLFKNIDNYTHQFKTEISFTLDKDSTITIVSFSTEENKELKEIIEKFIKSYNWIPGKLEGKEVTTKIVYSVDFSSMYK